MGNIKKLARQRQTFILIAPGFEESFVVACLCEIRGKGLPLWVVGLTNAVTNGMRGLTVRPDFSLSHLEGLMPFQAEHRLIIPGNLTCATMLCSDPRVHQLITAVIEARGYVVTTTQSEPALLQTNLSISLAPNHFFSQKDSDAAEYVQQLIHLSEAIC